MSAGNLFGNECITGYKAHIVSCTIWLCSVLSKQYFTPSSWYYTYCRKHRFPTIKGYNPLDIDQETSPLIFFGALCPSVAHEKGATLTINKDRNFKGKLREEGPTWNWKVWSSSMNVKLKVNAVCERSSGGTVHVVRHFKLGVLLDTCVVFIIPYFWQFLILTEVLLQRKRTVSSKGMCYFKLQLYQLNRGSYFRLRLSNFTSSQAGILRLSTKRPSTLLSLNFTQP